VRDIKQGPTKQQPVAATPLAPRKTYVPPRLEVFGAVSALTRAGTMSCMGDNPICDISSNGMTGMGA
jgi:hypothetical protein